MSSPVSKRRVDTVQPDDHPKSRVGYPFDRGKPPNTPCEPPPDVVEPPEPREPPLDVGRRLVEI